MNAFEADLQNQIAAGRVAVIVGAGVSVQATGGARCASWQGLLEYGAERAAQVSPDFRDKRQKIVREEIQSGDLDNLLSAAEKIARALGAPTGGEYRTWLRESVGALESVAQDVLEALRDLGLVLATTNYDGLLERISGLRPVTWRQGAAVERVLRGDDRAILHLHGHWEEPESVVLGVRSYDRVVGDAHAQNVLRALRLKSSLLFVGCGAGLDDPNFEQFRTWLSQVLRESEYRSYRLALDPDVDALQRSHGQDERIVVLGYGSAHAELAKYLRYLQRGAGSIIPKRRPAVAVLAPLPGRSFCFGRDAEVARLVAELSRDVPEPLAVLGPPGIGKSTIVLEALHDARVAAKYGARRAFVRCDAARSAAALLAEVARCLGVDPTAPLEPATIAAIGSAPLALALDNAETPWENEPLPVEELFGRLASIPGVALIATIRGNQRPGGVRWSDAVQPRTLAPVAARQAFLAIAGERFAADPEFEFLLDELDRLPLAVTLMAHEAEAEPNLRAVRDGWQSQRTQMLQRLDGRERYTSLEASYELSWNSPQLTETARRLLSVLGALPAGVAIGDVTQVAPEGLASELRLLRKRGLLQDNHGRIRLLAPLREYLARRHPAADGDLIPAEGFYVDLAMRAAQIFGAPTSRELVARLSADVANIETLLLLALLRPSPLKALEAAAEWAVFVRFTAQGTPEPTRAAASVAEESGDLFWLALCSLRLGDIALDRSQHEEARGRYEHALGLYRGMGEALGQATCTYGLGHLAQRRWELEEARGRFERALETYRQVGISTGVADCIRSLGDIALRCSKYDEARRKYDEALGLYRKMGDVLGVASCILCLGEIALKGSEYEEARGRFDEASRLYKKTKEVQGEANCLRSLGDLARAQSQREAATERYREALQIYQRISDTDAIAIAHVRMATVAACPEDEKFHRTEARTAWQSIGRQDLVDMLEDVKWRP